MKKVVIVTGATSGVGKECAEVLSNRGYAVYGTVYGMELDPSWEKLPYRLLPCDITLQQSVENFVSQVQAEAGRVDALINCAGFGMGGGVEDTTVEEAKKQFETNFFGTHRMCRQVLPLMREQNEGMILTISSVAAEFTIPFQSFYSTSKMAVDGLMQAIRMECGEYGIKAASINPGDIRSGFTAARLQAAGLNPASPYYQKSMKSINTMKHDELSGMQPREVADRICILLEKDKLKVRYHIETKYKLLTFIKRFLPLRLIEVLLLKLYTD
ncbi:MAG: SDR family oxidoreductase [Bacillota bacterium]